METSSCKGRGGKGRVFWKDTSKTTLWKGTGALQREELNTVMQRNQRHVYAEIKGQGRTLLPFNKPWLRNQGPCLWCAVLSMLNESLQSSERKERININTLEIKVKGMGELGACLHRMGQLLQKTNSKQRWVREKGRTVETKKSHSRGSRKCKGLSVEVGLSAHESQGCTEQWEEPEKCEEEVLKACGPLALIPSEWEADGVGEWHAMSYTFSFLTSVSLI